MTVPDRLQRPFELLVLLHQPRHFVDHRDARGIVRHRDGQGPQRLVPVRGVQSGHQFRPGQRGLRERRGEVRPLGDGVTAPGRLEDHVRNAGPVTELLDQTRLPHPTPPRHDHSLAPGGSRAPGHETQLPGQQVEVSDPALELHPCRTSGRYQT
ncbi:hypothetical protein SVIO_072620 [Streptomyces violaceusniger]|uniref:Uncharacterized protein n=1 Tax=Streptomyces violaceusniger TaxID=68280 RepID=A0A4D4LFF9_STRVO|nr:hypothetical protein SVIO_072620 [Streptomyces violaceusniger]